MENESSESALIEAENSELAEGTVAGEVVKGSFADSLKRNNKQIRQDRAQAIVEDTELIFKREIEDIELYIKKMTRERENMLDLSPTDAQSLTLASDFDSLGFVRTDLELGIKIRNGRIKLSVAKERYNYLFGGK